MQAITTKYFGPTAKKGARIRASAGNGKGMSLTIDFPHHLRGSEVHAEAARALCDKLGWAGRMYGGRIWNGAYVWVTPDRDLMT